MNESELASLLERIEKDEVLREWMLLKIARSACLPLTRFPQAVLREDLSAEESAHVATCEFCGKALAQVQRELWHPTLSVLVAYGHQNLSGEALAEVASHLDRAKCRRCARLLRVLSADRRLAHLWKESQQKLSGLPHVLVHAAASCMGFRRLAPVPGFQDSDTQQLPAQELALDDDGCTVAVVHWEQEQDLEGERHLIPLLAIESTAIPAGTLMYVGVAGETDSPVWELFMMLRPGYEGRSKAEARINPLPDDSCFPYMWEAKVELLADADVSLLRVSFSAARREDPDSVESWQRFARKSLEQTTLPSAIRAVLDEIAG